MSYKARQHPRFQTERIPLAVRASGTFNWLKGSVLNLSKGGVQIHTLAEFKVGQKLDLEFNTMDAAGRKHRRKFTATVQWATGNRYGLQFES